MSKAFLNRLCQHQKVILVEDNLVIFYLGKSIGWMNEYSRLSPQWGPVTMTRISVSVVFSFPLSLTSHPSPSLWTTTPACKCVLCLFVLVTLKCWLKVPESKIDKPNISHGFAILWACRWKGGFEQLNPRTLKKKKQRQQWDPITNFEKYF